MKTHDVLLLYSSTVDVILEMEGTFPILGGTSRQVIDLQMEPGGEGNILLAFNRMGGNILPTGPIGEDHYADFLRRVMEKERVDLSAMCVVPGFQPPIAHCIIDAEGTHSFVSSLASADYAREEEVIALLEQCRGMCLSGYYLIDPEEPFYGLSLHLAAHAAELGMPVFFDPGPLADKILPEAMQQVYRDCAVLCMNDTEAHILSGAAEPEQAAERLCGLTQALVIVKAGGRGCYVRRGTNAGKWYGGFRVRAVDSMGAGDSFLGALMFAWISGGDQDTCVTLANAAGAVKVSKYGTGTKVPTFGEMVAILEENGYNVPAECKNDRSFAKFRVKKASASKE